MTLINAAVVEWATRFYNGSSLGDVISLKACPLIRSTMLFLNDRLHFLWPSRKWSNQPFTTLAMNLYVSLLRVSVKLSIMSDSKCKCGCCGCWSSSILPTSLDTFDLSLPHSALAIFIFLKGDHDKISSKKEYFDKIYVAHTYVQFSLCF